MEAFVAATLPAKSAKLLLLVYATLTVAVPVTLTSKVMYLSSSATSLLFALAPEA